jgi:hypothetical protein
MSDEVGSAPLEGGNTDGDFQPPPLNNMRSTLSTTETIVPQPKPVKKKVSPEDKGTALAAKLCRLVTSHGALVSKAVSRRLQKVYGIGFDALLRVMKWISMRSLTCLYAVIVRFRAAGNAPIMKQSKFKITASESFQTVADFLRRQLKFSQHESLVWRCIPSIAYLRQSGRRRVACSAETHPRAPACEVISGSLAPRSFYTSTKRFHLPRTNLCAISTRYAVGRALRYASRPHHMPVPEYGLAFSALQLFQVDGKLDIYYCTTPAWG